MVFALLSVILIACLVTVIWLQVNSTRQQELVRQIQGYQKNDPLSLADEFVEAIGDKDFQLASTLVIQTQKKRLDTLEKSSPRWNMNCCNITTWFEDSCGWGFTSTSQDDAVDKTMIIDSAYGCRDHRSMSVEWMIIKFDQAKWVIVDWSEVCITTNIQQSEVCFP
jgi:hypothetical protein